MYLKEMAKTDHSNLSSNPRTQTSSTFRDFKTILKLPWCQCKIKTGQLCNIQFKAKIIKDNNPFISKIFLKIKTIRWLANKCKQTTRWSLIWTNINRSSEETERTKKPMKFSMQRDQMYYWIWHLTRWVHIG